MQTFITCYPRWVPKRNIIKGYNFFPGRLFIFYYFFSLNAMPLKNGSVARVCNFKTRALPFCHNSTFPGVPEIASGQSRIVPTWIPSVKIFANFHRNLPLRRALNSDRSERPFGMRKIPPPIIQVRAWRTSETNCKVGSAKRNWV